MTDTQTEPRPAPPARPGRVGARTFLHLRGVPIRLDASLLLTAGFGTYIFYGRFDTFLGDLPAPLVLAIAALTTVMVIGSILVHELGHAFASLDRGIPVIGITLFALGGVTESAREAPRARDEFVIVGIGPFLSVVLASVFGLLYLAVESFRVPAAIAGYLAWTNLMLAVFNVLPGYPLDGGRLLRSALWQATGRPHQATRWAARVGQVFAIGVMALAISPYLGLQPPEGLDRFAGLLNLFIGYFLLRGATAAHSQATRRERLGRRRARDVMGRVPATLAADLTIRQAREAALERPSLLWPVGSPVSGALTVAMLDRVPAESWDTMTAGEVALPAQQATVEADLPLDGVIERMSAAPSQMVVVVEHGVAIGLVTPSLVTEPTP